MAYGSISLEKRIKDNIRNYGLSSLLDTERMSDQIETLYKLTGVEVLVTDRHGEKVISYGDFATFHPDVEEEPGIQFRVAGRTVAHLYISYDNVSDDHISLVRFFMDKLAETYEALGEETYLNKELSVYADELEEKLEKESYQAKHGVKKDQLTGTLNRTYFENRMKIIDRSQIVPVAAICVNINDWKFVNDHFGDEGSDRLIQVVAKILLEKSKPEYVIGRVDGDVFNVLIPMPEEDEAQEYCRQVQEACNTFTGEHLAPSVAVGCVMKENVEETLTEKFNDAEYEMFENKLMIKNTPGYRERLEGTLQHS